MTDIVTLRLDGASQAFFERMRRAHYPPERNQIAAHLTLFHTLPVTGNVSASLSRIAALHACFAMQVSGLRSLGRGVAYTVHSPELSAIQRALAQEFAECLTPQDRQPFAPHVVVQNKTSGEAARALLSDLSESFAPFAVQAVGLERWHYLGGPWAHAEFYAFA